MSIVPSKEQTLEWINEWNKLPITCETPHSWDFIASRAAQWALGQAIAECEAVHSQLSDEYDINGRAAASWCAASIRAMITPEGNADIGKGGGE